MAYQRVLEIQGSSLHTDRNRKVYSADRDAVQERELVHFIRESYYKEIDPVTNHPPHLVFTGTFLHGPFETPPTGYPEDKYNGNPRFKSERVLVPVGFRDFSRVSYIEFEERITDYSGAMLKHLEGVDHNEITANRNHSFMRAKKMFNAEIIEDEESMRGSFSIRKLRGRLICELGYRKIHDLPNTSIRILSVGDLPDRTLSELGLRTLKNSYPHRIRDLVVHNTVREGIALTTDWEGRSLEDLLGSQDLIF